MQDISGVVFCLSLALVDRFDGQSVHGHPVAFTQDMQLCMRIPEIPDFWYAMLFFHYTVSLILFG